MQKRTGQPTLQKEDRSTEATKEDRPTDATNRGPVNRGYKRGLVNRGYKKYACLPFPHSAARNKLSALQTGVVNAPVLPVP
jgi:hypothetical protein